MQLATWNVNSLTARLPHLQQWMQAPEGGSTIDVLGLQELKMTDDKFPHAELAELGLKAEAFGQKTYNGVALIWRSSVSLVEGSVQRNIPGFTDEQSRIIAATFETPLGRVRVVNGYFVNGQAPGSEKFEYKMSWLRALRDWLREELATHPKLVLMGDFNITLDDRDTYDALGLEGTIHHTEEERHHLRELFALGLHDSLRLFNDAPKQFTWWDYRQLGFRKNQGLRIDYQLVSTALKPHCKACTVDKTPRKWERPSDHTPVIVTLEA